MRNTILSILFSLISICSFSQTFNVTKYTQLLGEGIMKDRYLKNSWIKVESDKITTHIVSSLGEVKESEWRVVRWIEWDETKNGVLNMGEVIIVLAQDGSEVEFSLNNETLWDGSKVDCLTFFQTYTGIKLRYDL